MIVGDSRFQYVTRPPVLVWTGVFSMSRLPVIVGGSRFQYITPTRVGGDGGIQYITPTRVGRGQ